MEVPSRDTSNIRADALHTALWRALRSERFEFLEWLESWLAPVMIVLVPAWLVLLVLELVHGDNVTLEALGLSIMRKGGGGIVGRT